MKHRISKPAYAGLPTKKQSMDNPRDTKGIHSMELHYETLIPVEYPQNAALSVGTVLFVVEGRELPLDFNITETCIKEAPCSHVHLDTILKDFNSQVFADDYQELYEGVELILRIILGRKDITIKSVRTQDPLKNLQGRSAILDVHAVDSTKKEFDVEIQRQDAGAGAKRARHNSSLLDAHILKPGDDTEDIPDSYVIFITENDVMKGSQPIYPVERYLPLSV